MVMNIVINGNCRVAVGPAKDFHDGAVLVSTGQRMQLWRRRKA